MLYRHLMAEDVHDGTAITFEDVAELITFEDVAELITFEDVAEPARRIEDLGVEVDADAAMVLQDAPPPGERLYFSHVLRAAPT